MATCGARGEGGAGWRGVVAVGLGVAGDDLIAGGGGKAREGGFALPGLAAIDAVFCWCAACAIGDGVHSQAVAAAAARVGAAGALCSALLMLKATGSLTAAVWVAVSAAVAVTV